MGGGSPRGSREPRAAPGHRLLRRCVKEDACNVQRGPRDGPHVAATRHASSDEWAPTDNSAGRDDTRRALTLSRCVGSNVGRRRAASKTVIRSETAGGKSVRHAVKFARRPGRPAQTIEPISDARKPAACGRASGSITCSSWARADCALTTFASPGLVAISVCSLFARSRSSSRLSS